MPMLAILYGGVMYALLAYANRVCNYTMSLGFIRFMIFWRLAKYQHKKDMIEAKHAEDRLNAMDEVYGQIVRYKPWAQIFLCINCQIFWVAIAGAYFLDVNFFVLLGGAILASFLDR